MITIIIIIAVVIYHAVFQFTREMSVPEEFRFITVDFDESTVDNMAIDGNG
jgi:N-acetylglutamate synthase/N-acetylornithine aminotransferase